MKLKNKFAIVTGASTGIGRAIAVELARQGAFVAITARTEDRLLETRKIIEKNGGKAMLFAADLSDLNSINKLISDIKNNTKEINIIANVAGVWHDKKEVYASNSFESFSQDVILKTYTVGITTPTLLVHSFLPLMTNHSKILNISGKFSHGAKNWLPYSISKRPLKI